MTRKARSTGKSAEHNENNDIVYYENSDEEYANYVYDERNNLIYYEDSKGVIRDSRRKK